MRTLWNLIWLFMLVLGSLGTVANAESSAASVPFTFDYDGQARPTTAYDAPSVDVTGYDAAREHAADETKNAAARNRALFACSVEFLAAKTALTKGQRLNMVYDGVTSAPRATTAQEAMQQMHNTLDAVEDAYSGIPKNPNPGLMPDGRMYPVQADRMVTGADGSITATSRGHVTIYGPNGSITVTDRATGAVVYHKPGGG